MLFDDLKAIVGARHCRDQDLEPYLTEWRDRLRGRTFAVVFPATTQEVAAVVRCCAAAGTSIVPQGGNTGLCGGAIPDESGEQVVLSMSRMNRIRSIDANDFSMVAEAGCVLANLQQAARDAGRYFPLSLSAEGSCQIGGNLATNAGGINVVRYGTARDQALGLEVVLADGTIIDGLRSLQKDTAGYDLKHLFIGSEGTLGIITAACLRLYPDPGEPSTALVALREAGDAVELLAQIRTRVADQVQAFELISRRAFEFVGRHIPNASLPFAETYEWYVLVDVAQGAQSASLETALADAGELVLDAVIAKNRAEAGQLWRMRHSISEAQKPEGPSLKHDVSVPVGRMQEFLARCSRSLQETGLNLQPIIFGHVGDGNLHYNVTLPAEMAAETEQSSAVTRLIYDLVAELGGSFSAEHGIGVLKRDYLARYRSQAELGVMRSLKTALDPANTLNPGKVI